MPSRLTGNQKKVSLDKTNIWSGHLLRYSVILFDLDGTLLDTSELILASYQHTLERYCPGKYSREAMIPYFGEPLRDTMKRFDPEQAEAMVETYRQYNVRHHDELIRIFPDVREVVAKLYKAGIKMGVVTNKRRQTAEMGLKHYNLEKYMQTMVCYGEAERPKPDAAPIHLALKQMGATPDQALMVGDSRFDLLSAQEAKVSSVFVKWSLHPLDSIQALLPTYIIEEMSELLSLVKINSGSE